MTQRIIDAEKELGISSDWDRIKVTLNLMNRVLDDGRLNENEMIVLHCATGATVAIQMILEAMQKQIDRLTEAVIK